MYRLIATDIDGTLLDDNSSLPGYNKKAILECRKKGIEIVLATGKTMDSIRGLVTEFGLNTPQITQNGSLIVSPSSGLISAIRIDPLIYIDVIKFLKQNGYPPLIALTDGKLYLEEYILDFNYLRDIGEEFIKVESIEEDHFVSNAVDIFLPIPEFHFLENALKSKYSNNLQFIRSGKHFFDILDPMATKGNALLEVISKLGIKSEEVIAFGDSPNDLSMFEIANLGIAVGNAYKEVLEKADIITDDNNSSGLGKAVFKYIFKDNG